MSSLLRRSGKGYAWNQAARTADYLLTYLLGLVIARGLGDDLYGSFVIFLSLSQVVLVLTSAGLESSIPATAARLFRADGTDVKGGGLAPLFLLRVGLIALVALIVFLLQAEIAELLDLPPLIVQYTLLLLAYTAIRGLASLSIVLLTAGLRTRRVAIVTLIVRVAEVTLAYLLIAGGSGLGAVFLLLTVTNGVQLLGCLPPWKALGPRVPGISREVSGLGVKFWIISMSEFLLGRQADVLILGFFLTGAAAIAHYDVGMGLAQGINMAFVIGFQGIAVATLSFAGPENTRLARSYWLLFAKVTIVLTVPALVFCIFAAREIVLTLYTAQFQESVLVLQTFAGFLIVTRLLAGGTAANYLAAARRTGVLLFSSILSGGLNVALAFLLVPNYGILGAVLATGVAALAIALIHARVSTRLLAARLPWKTGLLVLAASSGAALIARLVSTHLGFSHLGWLVSLYVLIFTLIAYLLKPLSTRDTRLLSEINSRLGDLAGRFARPEVSRIGCEGSTVQLLDRQKWAYQMLPHSGSVLDVGSSDGPLCRVLHTKASVVIAVDLERTGLESVRESPGIHGLVQAGASLLPFRNGSIETLLLLDVLEHTRDQPRVIEEAHRVLSRDGTMILSVPNSGIFAFLDPQNVSSRLRGKLNTETYHRHYGGEELAAMLGPRFEIVESHYGGLFLYPCMLALGNFVEKRLRLDWGRFFYRLGDLDNDISWGRWSYNVILKTRKR